MPHYLRHGRKKTLGFRRYTDTVSVYSLHKLSVELKCFHCLVTHIMRRNFGSGVFSILATDWRIVCRCASPDYGVIGCGVEVLDIMDWRCSGLPRCSFKVPDDDMYRMSDCPQQVSSYLEASYTCITGAFEYYFLVRRPINYAR